MVSVFLVPMERRVFNVNVKPTVHWARLVVIVNRLVHPIAVLPLLLLLLSKMRPILFVKEETPFGLVYSLPPLFDFNPIPIKQE